METIQGLPASAGLAMGTVRRLRFGRSGLGRHVGDPRYELALFEGALRLADEELVDLEQRAEESDRDIFMVQRMMLQDGGLLTEIRNYVRVGAGAAAAVERAAGIYAQQLRALNDSYLSERAADVLDACRRVVDILDGGAHELPVLQQPCIVATEELYPSDLIALDRTKILGFITSAGAVSAHVAILARTMGIPAVVQAGDMFLETCDGKVGALDGEQGALYLVPDEVTKARFSQKRHMHRRHLQALEALRALPCETLDGTAITLLANCTGVQEVEEAVHAGACGVGLLHSEYTLLAGKTATEDELYHFYMSSLAAAQGRPVTVSTYDLGYELNPAVPQAPEQLNPAMGVRGVRYCFRHYTFFLQQLCAMLRAAAHGPLRIVLPMVSTPDDVTRARGALEDAKAVLRARGVPYAQDVPLGVLVETPSSALLSDILARHIDFFHINTNNLTQFAYAADRANSGVQHYLTYDAPAVTRLVQYVLDNATKAGREVCVCGESASDTQCAEMYVRSGVRQLSVPAHCLPEMKAHLRSIRL